MKQLIEELRGLRRLEIVGSHHCTESEDGTFIRHSELTALIQKYERQPECKHIHKPGDSCAANNNCTYPDCPTMSAEEFRLLQDFKYDHFQELTSTGINPNYQDIDAFAEQYAAHLSTPSLTNEPEMSGHRLTAEEFFDSPDWQHLHHHRDPILELMEEYASQVRDDGEIVEFAEWWKGVFTSYNQDTEEHTMMIGVDVMVYNIKQSLTYWRENVKGK